VKLAIIAAVARNRVIGKGGRLPWRLPDDLKRFKRLTTGHAVVMGRKTWESLGKPLAGRRNVVISSAPVQGAEWHATVAAALTALAGEERVFVIGGATLYAQVLVRADELYLTLVHRTVEGDVSFPPYEHLLGTDFIERSRESHGDFEFVDYVRRST
jgi:dihydrofolate reductase